MRFPLSVRVVAPCVLLALVLALLVAVPPGAAAAPAVPEPEPELSTAEAVPAGAELAKELQASGEEPARYIVRLADEPVATYDGGEPGLAPTRVDTARGQRLDADAAPVQAYRDHLLAEQDAVLDAVSEEVGRDLDPRFTYTNAYNGFALELSGDEAAAFAVQPGVVDVQRDEVRRVQTDNGPAWIGAPAVYPESVTTGVGTKGEGIVVGILDTGINPSNPSFADVGDDGYDHELPDRYDGYLGACDPADTDQYDPSFPCNDKLIGAYGFLPETSTAVDDDGHGSHTASTAAGNVVQDALVEGAGVSATRDIAGVAPHANIISYNVCETTAGCFTSSITAAIDQAIADEVDAINYSIGSTAASDLYTDADTVGFLNARAAGIFVATSAGNSGPGAATVGSPADAPWITAVGASTHDRIFANSLVDATGGEPLPAITGKGFTGGYGPAPLVYAGDYGNPLCLAGEFAATVDFDGAIVLCDRGQNGRVEKSKVVADAGAGGFVLANDPPNATTLNADAFAVPGVHVTYADGVALKAWLEEAGDDAAIRITGGEIAVDDAYGDVMAAFSSRGPNRAAEVVTPSVTAPGVDILAAVGAGDPQPPEWGFVSGTSMSSPHVAGVGALLTARHPDWSPAQMQSAIMTTADTTVLEEDGETPADPFDMGSGRVDVARADAAGLVLDVTTAEYRAADPAEGGDLKDLNLPSFADAQCLATCSWTRTVTSSLETATVTWTASTSGDVPLDVEPATVTLAPGASAELTVTATTEGLPDDAYLFGRVVLTPDDAAVPAAGMPVAVQPSDSILPDVVEIPTRRDAGSQLVEDLQAVGFDELATGADPLAPSVRQDVQLPQDSDNASPYDDLDDGVAFTLVDVPADAARLVAEVTDATARDVDLFVGRDVDGDGLPEANEEVCRSATATFVEVCDLLDPEAGTYWVLVQNWQASAAGPTDPPPIDTITYGTAVVRESAGGASNLRVEGPASAGTGAPFDVRVFFDEPAMEAGQTWYGAVTLGTPEDPDRIGTIPVTVDRLADDVTKTADVTTARPGDTITYTLQVQPNVTDTDLTYTITDALPPGLSYVEGSATGGATVQDGVVTWTRELPTLVGAPGSYDLTTSAETAGCAVPFGSGGYVDFTAFGIFPQAGVTGDDVLFTVTNAPTDAPYEFYGAPYDAVGFTDDGYLLFGGLESYGGGVPPQALPDPALPNGVVAPLWEDWELVYDGDPAAPRGVSIVNLGGTGPASARIIDYARVERPGTGPGAEPSAQTSSFQAWYFRSVSDAPDEYEVYFAYDGLGPLPDPTTVGVEDPLGEVATTLVNAEPADGTVTDDLVVCLDYEGPVPEPATATFQVRVDPGVGRGVIANTAVHTTDDPGAEPAEASAAVRIGRAPGQSPGRPGTGAPGADGGPGTPGAGDGDSRPGDDGPGEGGPDDPGTGEPGPTAPALLRVAGGNRIATAIAISRTTFDEADTVVLARADAYPDALAGSSLASAYAGPLLLNPVDSLDEAVLAEVRRLGATRVVLLGGEQALDAGVAALLAEAGLTVERIGGASRFATAGLVEDALDEVADSDEVVIVEGGAADPARGWPDALSASGLAASRGIPILLATQGSLPAETAEALEGGDDVLVVGGTAAVGDEVASAVDELTGDVRRLAGATRYGTSAAVAEEALARGSDLSATWVATGLDFPDALAAGAAAGAGDTTVLLVDGQGLDASPESRAFLAEHADVIDTVAVAGGVHAVAAPVAEELAALTSGGP